LAKRKWLETDNALYKKIGKLLVAYCGSWDSLIKQLALSQIKDGLPDKILELI
jgi:hypothetical protein